MERKTAQEFVSRWIPNFTPEFRRFLAAHAADVGVELARSLSGEVALIHVVDPAQNVALEGGVPAAELIKLAESLGLIAVGWRLFNLGQRDGRLQTFTFLTLLFFALFSIVSIRERRAFWASRPSWVLIAALTADACIGIAIGRIGLAELRPLPLEQIIVVFAYALVASLLVNDFVKLTLIARLWNTPRPDAVEPSSE